MGFACGIVGLPNVGKSTLFNALTATQAAESANYPFCTIEPNVGKVAVPDARLAKIAEVAQSAKVIAAQMDFVDIAGLVQGAAKGEGLGNQFLGHIRNVDAIGHVLRCFADKEITHVQGEVDTARDIEVIETELMLADLESLEKRLPNWEKRATTGDKMAKQYCDAMRPALQELQAGRFSDASKIPPDAMDVYKHLNLLTSKPMMLIGNISEQAMSGEISDHENTQMQNLIEKGKERKMPVVFISAAIEAEIAALPDATERQEFLKSMDRTQSGLEQVIANGYQLLNLMTYFTAGPKETRAWTVKKNAKANEAAGVIHTDFQRGFIAAETISFEDYLRCGGEANAKQAGALRTEGKQYQVQDGDIINFRFNV